MVWVEVDVPVSVGGLPVHQSVKGSVFFVPNHFRVEEWQSSPFFYLHGEDYGWLAAVEVCEEGFEFVFPMSPKDKGVVNIYQPQCS